MKKLTSFLLTAVLSLSSAATAIVATQELFTEVTANAADTTVTETTTEAASPTATATATVTETPTETAISTEAATPTETETAETDLSSNSDGIVYVIRNSGNMLFTYENGEFTVSPTYSESNDSVVSMKNINNSNYVPFRYLFELFEIEEKVGNKESNSESTGVKGIGTEDEDGLIQKLLSEDGFIWGADSDDVVNIILRVGENIYRIKNVAEQAFESIGDARGAEILDKLINGDQTSDSDKMPDAVYFENDSIYIPLRAVALAGYDVAYDGETDAIFISKTELKVDGDNYTDVMNTVKNEYMDMFNDNHATYSYAYISENGVTGLADKNGKRPYSVNQFGDMLIYLDNNMRAKISITGSSDGEQSIQFDNSYDPIIDQIIYDGRKIYGTIIPSTTSSSGNIFIADLELKKTETGFEYFATNMQVIAGIEARYTLLKTIGTKVDGTTVYTRYLYFIDYTDQETVKRMNVSTGGIETINVVSNGQEKPLTNIAHFDLADGYMIYNEMNREIHAAIIDGTGSRVVEIGNSVQVGNGVNGMIADEDAKSGYRFYFIGGSNDGGTLNKVFGVTINNEGIQTSCIYEHDESGNEVKVRNIALINDVLYGVINDSGYKEIFNLNLNDNDKTDATDEPEKTAEPDATDEPETTAEPDATDEPETTAEPDATDGPETTANPETTSEPKK